jgi:hypothetical protein
MGIDPEFNLWNYFFCVQCPHVPDVELIVSRGAVIHVKSKHIVNPYVYIPMPKLMKGWRKNWFHLMNDTDALLSVFTGNRPIPQPCWGYGVAKKYIDKLQPVDTRTCHYTRTRPHVEALDHRSSNRSDWYAPLVKPVCGLHRCARNPLPGWDPIEEGVYWVVLTLPGYLDPPPSTARIKGDKKLGFAEVS